MKDPAYPPQRGLRAPHSTACRPHRKKCCRRCPSTTTSPCLATRPAPPVFASTKPSLSFSTIFRASIAGVRTGCLCRSHEACGWSKKRQLQGWGDIGSKGITRKSMCSATRWGDMVSEPSCSPEMVALVSMSPSDRRWRRCAFCPVNGLLW